LNQITILSNNADQQVFIPLTDGSLLQLEFIYRPRIQRWEITVTHPDLPGGVASGMILCVSPNIMRPWKNLLSFGIAVLSTDGYDPVDINDFSNNRISVYVLTEDEVQMVENQIIGFAT
jgi:hypothetical protein